MNRILQYLIQVIVALVVLVILSNISVAIMKQEGIINDPTKRIQTKLFTGWVDTASFNDKHFNIHNQFAKTYRSLPHSVNKFGGAQFSYTLWVKLNDTSPKNLADQVLFMQGDTTKDRKSVV